MHYICEVFSHTQELKNSQKPPACFAVKQISFTPNDAEAAIHCSVSSSFGLKMDAFKHG